MEIGFLGLGIMGSRMAANVARAGHRVTVYNRTTATAQAWVAEHGGTVAQTPAQAAAAADVVISMVVDGAQVEQVLLGPDGAADGARPGALFVDMSTISPDDTRRIGAGLAERGVAFVDAPVTGSSPKAQDGTLTIMAGGAEEDVRRAWPLFEAMGSLVLHVGGLGQGEMVKLINNATAAANALAVAQALVVGRATGVDLGALVQVMSAGSGGSAMLDLKAPVMQEHDYTTLFKLEHMLKDVRLCLEQARAAGVGFDAAAAAGGALEHGLEQGLGEADFAALLEAVEAASGVRL